MKFSKTLILFSSLAFVPLSWAQQTDNNSDVPVANTWAGSYIGVTLGRSQGERRTVSSGSVASASEIPATFGCINTSSGSNSTDTVIPGQTTEESCLTSGKPGTHVWGPLPGSYPTPTQYLTNYSESTATRQRNTLGLKMGHNWQDVDDRMVYGIELDYTHLKRQDSEMSTSSAVATVANINSITTTSTLSGGINWVGTLRGRIGYSSEDNTWLPYLTAGLAFGGIKTQGTATFNSNLAPTVINQFNQSSVKSGLVYGLGLDYRIDKNLVLNMSYMRAQLGSKRTFLDGQSATGNTGATAGTAYGSLDPYVNLAAIGLSYKFD